MTVVSRNKPNEELHLPVTAFTPYVTAVVLNWNDLDATSACIESLQALEYQNLDIIVVDNGSEDESGQKLNSAYPEITVLLEDENHGFGGGINIGTRVGLERGADYVWILNNDIVVRDCTLLSAIVDRIETIDDAGILSPRILEEGSEEAWFEKGIYDPVSGNTDHVSANGATLVQNEYVPYCCALVHSSVFTQVGLLDENYFIYYDDVDHCLRARENGFKVVTDLEQTVHHQVSESSGGALNPMYSYYRVRNRLYFSEKFLEEMNLRFYLIYVWWLTKMIGERIIGLNYNGVIATISGLIAGIRQSTGKGFYPRN